jgi:hypothetical protein
MINVCQDYIDLEIWVTFSEDLEIANRGVALSLT